MSDQAIKDAIDHINSLPDADRQLTAIVELELAHPEETSVLSEVARIFVENGKYTEAIIRYKHLSKLFADKERLSLMYIAIGFCYLMLKKTDEAIPYYQKASEGGPQAFTAYNMLGNIYFGKNDHKTARDYYLKVYHLDEAKDDKVSIRLSTIENEEKNIPLAIKYAKDAIRINPDNPQGYVQLAGLYANHQKPQETSAFLDDACRKFPDNVDLLVIYVNAGAYFLDELNNENTIAMARKLFALAPGNKDAIISYGCAIVAIVFHYITGGMKRDQSLWEEMRNTVPVLIDTLESEGLTKFDKARIYVSLGQAFGLVNMSKESKEYMEKAKELYPD